ncbi:MAG: peptidoglycan DD-metalloendopeptidase family protein [Tuberibacillus sp.]
MENKTYGRRKILPVTAKIMAAAAMATTVTLGWNIQSKAEVAEKKSQSQHHIHTVYHVYYGSKPIGTVNNKEMVHQLINDAITRAKKTNPQLDYVLAKDLTIIPEKTFDSTNHNKQTIHELSQIISVKPYAVAIVIDGKPVVYVKSKEDAENVLQQFKAKFVPEDILKVLAADQHQMVPIGQMAMVVRKTDGSTKLHLTKDVDFQDDKVDQPSQLKNVQEAVHILSNGEIKDSKYIAQEGDTLGGIAGKFNMSLQDLLTLNPGINENTLIGIGDALTVKKPQPYLEVVIEKDIVKYEDIHFKTVVKENPSMYQGESKLIQKGRVGKKRVTYHQTIKNGQIVSSVPISENVLEKPSDERVEKGTKVVSYRGTGHFIWPANGGLSSPFGYRWGEIHKGIDISKTGGLNIKAADNGVVVSAGWDDSGYGNRIVINHNNGFQTTYNHLSRIAVRPGQVVRQGQSIGTMGQTGSATGIHLHFEIYKNGSLVNPISYLP